MFHPMVFAMEMMGDIMYFHQAMKQEDNDQFVNAIVKAFNVHINNQR